VVGTRFFTWGFFLVENTFMGMLWFTWNKWVRAFDPFGGRFCLYSLSRLLFPKECHVLGDLKFLWDAYSLSLVTNYQLTATTTFRNLAAWFPTLCLFCCFFRCFIYFVVSLIFYPIIFLLFSTVYWCICFFEGFFIKTNLFQWLRSFLSIINTILFDLFLIFLGQTFPNSSSEMINKWFRAFMIISRLWWLLARWCLR
jgi:hypothetical protein